MVKEEQQSQDSSNPLHVKPTFETFDSLNQKYEAITKEMSSLQRRIEAAKQSASIINDQKHSSHDEDLDAYMATLER